VREKTMNHCFNKLEQMSLLSLFIWIQYLL